MKPARNWYVSSADSYCKHVDEQNGGGTRMGDKRSKWNAPMSVVRSVEADFFPLDKELQVPDGHLLPHAQDTLISMSSELPVERAVKHLERTLGLVVHASTAR